MQRMNRQRPAVGTNHDEIAGLRTVVFSRSKTGLERAAAPFFVTACPMHLAHDNNLYFVVVVIVIYHSLGKLITRQH